MTSNCALIKISGSVIIGALLGISICETSTFPCFQGTPNCDSTGYKDSNQYDCARVIRDTLNNQPSDGSRFFQSAFDGCAKVFGSGECVISICRSPDTRNNVQRELVDVNYLSPKIEQTLALTAANYVLAACAKSDRVVGKVSVKYTDDKGSDNTIDVLVSGANRVKRRKMMEYTKEHDGVIITRAALTESTWNVSNHKIYKMRRNMIGSGRRMMPEEGLPEITAYYDNGAYCIRRRNSPYILRREIWIENPGDGVRALSAGDTAEELAANMENQIRGITAQHAATDVVTVDRTDEGVTYRGYFDLLNDQPNHNYFGDLNVQAYTGYYPNNPDDPRNSEPYYGLLLADAAAEVTNSLDVTDGPRTARADNLRIGTFGVYNVGNNNNQNPSTGQLRRWGTIIFSTIRNVCG